MVERVSIAEAAARLTARGDAVSRTSLSRYVKRYADVLTPRRRGRETLIDFDLLVRHRAENVHVDAQASTITEAVDHSPPGSTGTDPRLTSRARREEAVAGLAWLDFQDRLGNTCPTAEVEQATIAATRAAIAGAEVAINEQAERVAAALGIEARVIRPHLKSTVVAFREALIEMLHAEIDKLPAVQRLRADATAEAAE